ncbi:hypothetical protein ABZ202_21340 [Streptomyces sp. NPDC006186]|uniref:Uncharacterized protein n=1 Tax=Streptomyces thermocoprophilus TaxID=78356 RepID=A0ABV5VF66_9ACTN
MSPRPLKAAATLAASAALCLSAAPAHAAPDPDVLGWTELAKTYAATSRFAYEPLAVSAGFTRSDTCVADTGKGGLGYHYIKAANVGSLDPAKPAGLVYTADENGARELAAVEWVVEDTGQAAPKLFGETFSGDVMPGHYTLVAWIFRKNPSGALAPWNTTLSCASATAVSAAPSLPGTATAARTNPTDTGDDATTAAAGTDTSTSTVNSTTTADDLTGLGDLSGLGDLNGLVDLSALTGLAESLSGLSELTGLTGLTAPGTLTGSATTAGTGTVLDSMV